MKSNLLRSLPLLFAPALVLGLGFVSEGCGGGSSGGGAVPVPVATNTLTVESFSPPTAATGIPLTAVVVVTFDKAVNPLTINDTSFVVSDGAQITGGTLVYNVPTRTVFWTPPAQLVAMRTHTVTLTAGILAAVGNTPLTAGTFSFTTGNTADMTAPTFNTPATAAVAANGVRITVSWSTAGLTDVGGDATSYLSFRIYRATSMGGHNFTTDLVGIAGPGATSFDDTGLTAGTPYFYVVHATDTSLNEEANVVEGTTSTNALRSYGTDVFPLFNLGAGQTCSTAGCHDAGTQSGGLLLTPAATAYGDLVGVISNTNGGNSPLDRVEPGDPDRSHLYLKLTFPAGTPGSIMPSGALPLLAADLDIIADWIEEGAANN